jgi:hypothetical protein
LCSELHYLCFIFGLQLSHGLPFQPLLPLLARQVLRANSRSATPDPILRPSSVKYLCKTFPVSSMSSWRNNSNHLCRLPVRAAYTGFRLEKVWARQSAAPISFPVRKDAFVFIGRSKLSPQSSAAIASAKRPRYSLHFEGITASIHRTSPFFLRTSRRLPRLAPLFPGSTLRRIPSLPVYCSFRPQFHQFTRDRRFFIFLFFAAGDQLPVQRAMMSIGAVMVRGGMQAFSSQAWKRRRAWTR